MYCRKCGKELISDAAYCSSCGISVEGIGMNATSERTAYYMPYAEKSVGIALVLGFLCIGLGHLYIGKLKRGLCIMSASIILAVVLLIFLFSFISDTYLTNEEATVIANVMILAGIFVFILLLVSLFDVNKLTKEYNDHVRRTGTPPW